MRMNCREREIIRDGYEAKLGLFMRTRAYMYVFIFI